MNNKHIKLTPRLLMVASLVKEATNNKQIINCVADIGTDHAFLPVYLLQQGIISKAFACDINKMPLEKAISTIKEYKMQDKITPILSDGIKEVPINEVTHIVMAGMGGELISYLLEMRKSELKDISLILQPMSAIDELREYLLKNGYEIITEKISTEKDKTYIAMSVKYTGKQQDYSEYDILIGKFFILNNTENRNVYINKLKQKYLKQINGLIKSNNPKFKDKITKLKKLIDFIDNIK